MSLDVITFGETMLRLTPPGFDRLEQATTLELHIGGSESNTAVGLARLGCRTAWLSRLPDTSLGHLVASTIGRYGVDVSHVVWSDTDRLGTYYLERGKPPRGSQVLYDRRESAISKMQPNELPSHMFSPHKAKLFHTTGISLGISESAAATAQLAAELAKAAGMLVSFDVNYRAKLWRPEAAHASCVDFIKLADIVFMPLRDAHTVFGLEESTEEATLQNLARHFPHCTIVMTLGARGAIAIDRNGETHRQTAFPTTEVERLGSGDAFAAGYLANFLEQGKIASGLRWGCATASLKYTIPGDLPLIHRREVEALVASECGSTDIVR
jgi:2-dehydro-3-deoxygluconokinase